jgi:DNA invertase Pin-like site-specific DNA recombinase
MRAGKAKQSNHVEYKKWGTKVIDEDLRGKRVVIAARCSTKSQAEASIPRQVELGQAYAQRHGMIVVDVVPLEGKSATLRQHVPALRNLIKRKRERQDYEVLWFFTLSRFDRNRADGEELFREFEKENVLIVTEKQGCFTGKYGWLKRGICLQESQAFVEDLAVHTRSGRLRFMKEGTIPHTGVAPFAVDKLYLDSNGAKQYILRHAGRGKMHRINPTTGTVEGLMIREEGAVRIGSQRIAGGKIRLVPGAPKLVAIAQEMFDKYYRQKWGATRIAGWLNNDLKLPALGGGLWTYGTVQTILRNLTYVGVGVACRLKTGRYCAGSGDGIEIFETPREFPVRVYDQNERCEHMRSELRPMKQWLLVECPAMREFLPEPLRQVVQDGIWAYWKCKTQRMGKPKETNVDGRTHGGYRYDHTYYLSGIMRSLQGNLRMNGRCVYGHMTKMGTKRKYRTYHVGYARNTGNTNMLFKRAIPAEPVEKAVYAAVQEGIGDGSEVQRLVTEQVKAAYEASTEAQDNLQSLRDHKAQIEERYVSLKQDLGPRGRELMKLKIDEYENQLDALEQQIETVSKRNY